MCAPGKTNSTKTYDAKVDVWSVGMCLAVLLAGLPRDDQLHSVWKKLHSRDEKKTGSHGGGGGGGGGGDGDDDARDVSSSLRLDSALPLPKSTPRRFRRLIASLLAVDPAERPSASEALVDNAAWLLPNPPGGRGSASVVITPSAATPVDSGARAVDESSDDQSLRFERGRIVLSTGTIHSIIESSVSIPFTALNRLFRTSRHQCLMNRVVQGSTPRVYQTGSYACSDYLLVDTTHIY